MCSAPVTFGGGITIVNAFAPGRGFERNSPAASHAAKRAASMGFGSYGFASLCFSLMASQQVRGERGQRRALALRERHVAEDRLVLEALDEVRQSVRGRVEVVVVHLVRIAGQDDLRALARARDDR